MATRTKNYPDVPIPPGEYLAEEIKERGASQKELAKRMGRPTNAINEIINGKGRPLPPKPPCNWKT